jgi:hypothetical protein
MWWVSCLLPSTLDTETVDMQTVVGSIALAIVKTWPYVIWTILLRGGSVLKVSVSQFAVGQEE